MLKDERKVAGGERALPRVADFEQRLKKPGLLKLFRKRVVYATQAGTKFEENCGTKLYRDFITKSDEAFCFLVVKNNDQYLDAVAADEMVELKTAKEKQTYKVRWTKCKGGNIKDGGTRIFRVACRCMGVFCLIVVIISITCLAILLS